MFGSSLCYVKYAARRYCKEPAALGAPEYDPLCPLSAGECYGSALYGVGLLAFVSAGWLVYQVFSAVQTSAKLHNTY